MKHETQQLISVQCTQTRFPYFHSTQTFNFLYNVIFLFHSFIGLIESLPRPPLKVLPPWPRNRPLIL